MPQRQEERKRFLSWFGSGFHPIVYQWPQRWRFPSCMNTASSQALQPSHAPAQEANEAQDEAKIVPIALLIGINYPGTNAQLRGCINDIKSMFSMLQQHCGVEKAIFLADEPEHLVTGQHAISPHLDSVDGDNAIKFPTRNNIFEEMERVVKMANDVVAQGDKPFVFFHYSGHGGSTIDLSGDEVDHLDETLYPCDFATAGHIVDDDIRDKFLAKLPAEARCFLFMDECHSGTIADLPHKYDPQTGNVTTEEGVLSVKARVMSISGCMDKQTSADAFIENTYQGATTAAATSLLPSLMRGGASVKEVGDAMHTFMREGNYTQRPQICASFSLRDTTPFLLGEMWRA